MVRLFGKRRDEVREGGTALVLLLEVDDRFGGMQRGLLERFLGNLTYYVLEDIRSRFGEDADIDLANGEQHVQVGLVGERTLVTLTFVANPRRQEEITAHAERSWQRHLTEAHEEYRQMLPARETPQERPEVARFRESAESYSGALREIRNRSGLAPGGERTLVCLATVELPADFAGCAAISTDWRYAVTGGGEDDVTIWDLESGTWSFMRGRYYNSVYAVALNADATRAAAGGDGDYIYLWDLEQQTRLATLEWEGEGSVHALAMRSDARYLLSAYGDAIRWWDLDGGSPVWTRMADPEAGADSVLALSPDGSRAVSAGALWDNTVRLWDTASGHCLRTLEGHEGRVRAVAISDDAQYALSGSEDKTVKLWDLDAGTCVHSLGGHPDDVTSVGLVADSRIALSGTRNGVLRLWDLERAKCLKVARKDEYDLSWLTIAADGNAALSVADDKTIRLWRLG